MGKHLNGFTSKSREWVLGSPSGLFSDIMAWFFLVSRRGDHSFANLLVSQAILKLIISLGHRPWGLQLVGCGGLGLTIIQSATSPRAKADWLASLTPTTRFETMISGDDKLPSVLESWGKARKT